MTKAISRFEVNLVRVLHGLVEQAPAQRILPMLLQPLPRPKCLSQDAVDLVQDTLAKGCVHWLARHGWMRERFLSRAVRKCIAYEPEAQARAAPSSLACASGSNVCHPNGIRSSGRVVEGRLWERTAPLELGLTFSAHTLEFLVQLVSGTVGTSVPKVEELTLGDRLVMLLSFNVLRHTDPGEKLRIKWTPLHHDGLCRLAFLEELLEGAQRFRIDWQTWTTGLGASILETLQGWLAERWTEVERKKESVTTVARLRKLGATQTRVFGEYLDALAQVERRDLARCLLETAQRLLHDQPTAQQWLRSLDVGKERVADRLAIYGEAFAFLRQLERLHDWQRQAVNVGYFDDGYAASQLWKADWERCGGDQLCERAGVILRERK